MITIAGLCVLGLPSSAFAQTNGKEVFREKLKEYAKTHQERFYETMPVLQPASESVAMPAPFVSGFMQDPETGLRYYPRYKKIYDPETKYAYDLLTGRIYKPE